MDLINKLYRDLSQDDQNCAVTARQLFEAQKEHESVAEDAKQRGKSLADGLLQAIKADRVTFDDGYYITKQESVRVSYSEVNLQTALLNAGLSADKVGAILVEAAKPTAITSIFGKAPKS